MPSPPPPRLLLTGPPGVGKTTVVQGVVDQLRAAAAPVGGFLTRELREAGQRAGFEVVALDGPTATIAHVVWSSGPRVGRYHVDVDAFERVALAAVRQALRTGSVLVLDELGRMELASAAFVTMLDEVFTAPVALLATVHLAAHPVTDALKRRSDVELVIVTETNRTALPGTLADRLIKYWESSRPG